MMIFYGFGVGATAPLVVPWWECGAFRRNSITEATQPLWDPKLPEGGANEWINWRRRARGEWGQSIQSFEHSASLITISLSIIFNELSVAYQTAIIAHQMPPLKPSPSKHSFVFVNDRNAVSHYPANVSCVQRLEHSHMLAVTLDGRMRGGTSSGNSIQRLLLLETMREIVASVVRAQDAEASLFY